MLPTADNLPSTAPDADNLPSTAPDADNLPSTAPDADNQAIAAILELFQPGRSVAICGHLNPDGDSIGSIMALSYFLEARGLTVTRLLARESRPPAAYSFLKPYDFVAAGSLAAKDSGFSPDIFIAVDLSQPYRLGDAQGILARASASVNIDHHPEPDDFCDLRLWDDTAAAAGLLVWQLIEASGDIVTSQMATACYTAVLTDTGRFSYQNTTAAVLAAAARMVAAGADPVQVSQAAYESRPMGAILLDGRLISRMSYLIEGRVAYSWLTNADFEELAVRPDQTDNLVSILRSLAGIELAVLLREDGQQVRVNLRSPGSYDAGKLARDHGGGGHRAAAGFNYAGTIEEASEAIRHYIASEADLAALPGYGSEAS